MKPILVDSNVLLDIATDDPVWQSWSSRALADAANETTLVINALIYAEVSIGFRRIEDVEKAIPADIYRRDPLPYEAAFLAGKAFRRYRQRGGRRVSPLTDFYIGAHAAIADFRILTRDARRYQTYFPTVDLIAPRRIPK